MTTQFNFLDVNDYHDFEFFLNLVDPVKYFDDSQVELTYKQYVIFRDVYATNPKVHDAENGFRGYLVMTQNTKMSCPHCETEFDINDSESTHQVNDNDEETYCSYKCSAVATLMYLKGRMPVILQRDKDLCRKVIKIIDNT